MKIWMLAVTAVFLSVSTAVARNQPIACQADRSAGLNWELGRWEVRGFTPDPDKFILVLIGNSLSPESVAKAFSTGTPNCQRQRADGTVLCGDGFIGHSLFFSPVTMKGAYTNLLGGTMNNQQKKDSIVVTAFTCQPF